jgi:hypothetical protein
MSIHNATIDMINILYKDGNYKEALNGLLLLNKSQLCSNKIPNNCINTMIDICIKKLKEERSIMMCVIDSNIDKENVLKVLKVKYPEIYNKMTDELYEYYLNIYLTEPI